MTLVRLLASIGCFSAALYLYLHQQNQVTKLRYTLPQLEEQLVAVMEENAALRYEISQFESPQNLMTLLSQLEYSHLHQPELRQIHWIPVHASNAP